MTAAKRLRHLHAAHDDLLGIWQYTAHRWDVHQADRYLTDLDGAMHGIAAGRIVGAEHGFGYRKLRVRSHLIFYREAEPEVVIVRVLHVRMDADRHLRD